MANYTQSLSDNLYCFGPQPSTKYGTVALFGTDLYGDGGTDFPLPVSISLAAYNNSMSLTDSTGYIYLTDGSWYFYFPNTINDFNSLVSTYTAATNPSNAWTLQTTSSTTWTLST